MMIFAQFDPVKATHASQSGSGASSTPAGQVQVYPWPGLARSPADWLRELPPAQGNHSEPYSGSLQMVIFSPAARRADLIRGLT